MTGGRGATSIRIEQAANGYIVNRVVGILSADEDRRPMVFDSFPRMVDWMRMHFNPPVVTNAPTGAVEDPDDGHIAGRYPSSRDDPFGFGPNRGRER